jgi:hypothetical protein
VLDLAPPRPPAAVEVRTGRHDGFGRVVFDWPVPISFEAITTGRQLAVRFDRAGDLDVTKLAARLGAWLSAASASRGDRQSEVRLELRPGVTARAFKVDGDRVVVDLRGPSAQAVGHRAAAGPRASPGPARPADHDAGAAAHASPVPARPSLAPASGPAPARAVPPAAPRADTAATADLRIAAAVAADGASLEFAWTRPVAAAVFVRGAHLWVVFGAGPGQPDDVAMPAPVRDYLDQGERVAASGGTAFRFALRRPLAAAAWRDERTWRVSLGADARAPRPLYPLRLTAPARLRLAPGEPPRLVAVRDPETGDQLTVWPLLQADLGQPRQSLVEVELLATAQGLAWRLRSDRVAARTVGDAVEFEAPGGLALSAPAPGASASAALPPGLVTAAPEPGRTAQVATAPAPTAPAPSEQTPSPAPIKRAHGTPRSIPNSAPGISDNDGSSQARAKGQLAAPLGLVGRGLRPADTAPERRPVLLQALAQAAPDERDGHRLELARYYLSRALAAEALGILGALDDPQNEAVRGARQALGGAAALLLGRIDAAAAALGAAPFDDDPEVALWRAAVAASRQEWPQAAHELERSEQVLATYPQPLRLRLGLAAARAAIETGDAGLAATLLEQLDGLELAPAERARLAFLSGVAAARNGAIEAADTIWRPLEQDGPVDVRVQAAFARTELLLEAGELEPAQASARLAPTRGLWSGHAWEEQMLSLLAQLHLEAGDRPGALHIWRELLERFPAAPDAPAITARMRAVLLETLASEGEAALGPVRAYALFREFEPLVPHDEAGDGVRRRMAERLAALDLIREAAALLDALLATRPAVDRAAVGADLAELWLREPAPEAALAALERSRAATALPPALDQRRRILQATALARLEQRAPALALLDGLDGPAADALRVALLWQEQDWRRLIAAIERALAGRAPGSPLTEEEQVMVLELAIAHGRLGQSAARAQLRTRFGAALRAGPLEPAFLIATGAPDAAAPAASLAAAEQHLRRVRGYLEARGAD